MAGCQLVLLNGAGRVHILGTHLRALADKRASPDSVVLREDIEAFTGSLVPGVHVVPLRQGNGRGSAEQRVQSVNGTGRITQHAIDAHAELLVRIQLLWSLEVFFFQRLFYFPDDPGFRLRELHQEIRGVDHQIPEDREVFQRLHAYGARRVVGKERRAGQLGNAVHRHSAAPADPHAAGPTKRQRSVQMVLDVIQRIEHHPLLSERDLIRIHSRARRHAPDDSA